MTCHECQTQHVLHCIEWPPKLFVCSTCDSFFVLTDLTDTNEPIFSVAGYRRHNQ